MSALYMSNELQECISSYFIMRVLCSKIQIKVDY